MANSFARSIGAIVAVILWVTAAVAALDDAETQLTGGAAREWVLNGTHSFMGSTCTQDQEVDAFSSDHTLKVTVCLDGKPATTSHVWHVYQDSSLDTVLVIDGASYVLLFHKEGAEQMMRLRTRSLKTVGTFDRDFRLSED